ncbi:MAG TPA: hypothetical protein VH165_31545 [Kofleriaceae bacterium]|jgi:hypothetical protein|nr:hypothetical protein [Kofleriaceae bacterium]
MQFEDPQEQSTAYLILRHIYDGDVIEWPIADDHPLRHIFVAMEQQGYVARWDRVWPLHDRYRLTDKGIAAIEAVYKPGEAEAVMNDLRSQNLGPVQRRAYLSSRGYNPGLWPLLHDPSSSWDNYGYGYGHSRYHDWFWEDQQPYRYRRSGAYTPDADVPDLQVPDDPQPQQTSVVDLDREAQSSAPASGDYDVS